MNRRIIVLILGFQLLVSCAVLSSPNEKLSVRNSSLAARSAGEDHIVAKTKKPKHLFPIREGITSLAFSQNGKVGVFGTSGGLYLYKNGHISRGDAPIPTNDFIQATAVSADGKTIVVGESNGLVLYKNGRWRDYRYNDPDLTNTTRWFSQLDVTGIAMSKDGNVILVSTYQRGVYLYEDGVWKYLDVKGINEEAGIMRIAVSGNGKSLFVATYYNGAFVRINKHWQKIKFKDSKKILSAAFDFSGEKLLIGTLDLGGYLYSAKNPGLLKQLKLTKNYCIPNVFVSSDGENMFFVSKKHGVLWYDGKDQKFLDIKKGVNLFYLKNKASVGLEDGSRGVSFLYKKRIFLFRNILNWRFFVKEVVLNKKTKIPINNYCKYNLALPPFKKSDFASAMCMSSDGKAITVVTNHALFLYRNNKWYADKNKDIPLGSISSISMSSDGRTILVGTYNSGAYIKRNGKWQEITLSKDFFKNNKSILSTAISRDGKLMLIGRGCHCYIFRNGKWSILELPGAKYIRNYSSVIISDNSKAMYVGSSDKSFFYQNGKWEQIKASSWGANAAALSPDGKTLLISYYKNLYANGKWNPLKLPQFDNETFKCVALSADGKKALIGGDSSAYLFRFNSWKNLSHFELPKYLNVYCVGMARKGKKMFIGSEAGIYLFDGNKWNCLDKEYPFLGNVEPVSAKISDEGNILIFTTKNNGVFMLKDGKWRQFLLHGDKVVEVDEKESSGIMNTPRPVFVEKQKYRVNKQTKTIEWNN